jgi:hypothetical protein
MRRLLVLAVAGLLSVGPCVFAQPADDLKPLKAPGRGTLRGRVTWEGPLPDLTEINKALRQARDRMPNYLLPRDGRIEQQVWQISPGGGVRNVMVFLMPPPGTYFPMEKDDLDPAKAKWRKEVVMEVVELAYQPSHVILFPGGRDAEGKAVKTGQVFKVRVRDPDHFVVKVAGGAGNPGSAWLLQSGQEREAPVAPEWVPVSVSDPLHPWLQGWVRTFDHPYAVLTDGDGRFELRNVPAGVQVRVQAWHSQTGWLSPKLRAGDPVEVPVGKVVEHTFKARLID